MRNGIQAGKGYDIVRAIWIKVVSGLALVLAGALFSAVHAGGGAMPGKSPLPGVQIEPLRIKTFAFWGNTITGSDKATVVIVLTRPAPAGGVYIKLASGNQGCSHCPRV